MAETLEVTNTVCSLSYGFAKFKSLNNRQDIRTGERYMKLLNYTYIRLVEIGEIDTAQELSRTWCNKNQNWFAWQKHAGQDFSIDAAINCLTRTRRRLAARQDKVGQRGLAELEQLLSDYLRHKHRVVEIAAEDLA